MTQSKKIYVTVASALKQTTCSYVKNYFHNTHMPMDIVKIIWQYIDYEAEIRSRTLQQLIYKITEVFKKCIRDQ